MKLFIFLITLLFVQKAFAAEAIVLVLEAPLMSAPSLDSKVKQVVRRGDKIFLHDQHFSNSPWESTSEFSDKNKMIDEVNGSEEFFQTLSRDGQPAYIQAKYVKVIFQDIREKGDPVARFEVDPTDYRLEEPLPAGYPISEREKKKALALFNFGTHTKTSYPFTNALANETYHKTLGIQLIYAGKIDYDMLDRFYFGAKLGFDNNDVELVFQNEDSVKQSMGRFFAGPYISYDIYKSPNYRLTAFGNISLGYHRTFLTYKNNDGSQSQERSFKAWSITPEIGTYFQVVEVFPDTDFVLGANLVAQPSVELASSTPIEGNYWNEEQDVLTIDSGLRAMFSIGIQSRY